jgi:NMD protein affecting ribosome stability and mRNA decay
MSATAVAEIRIKGERKPHVTLCGDCGQPIHRTELLCEDCRVSILTNDTEEVG